MGFIAGLIIGIVLTNLFGWRRDRAGEYREFRRGYYLGHSGGMNVQDNVLTVNVDYAEVERRVIAELQKE